jgi:hypothetical protein
VSWTSSRHRPACSFTGATLALPKLAWPASETGPPVQHGLDQSLGESGRQGPNLLGLRPSAGNSTEPLSRLVGHWPNPVNCRPQQVGQGVGQRPLATGRLALARAVGHWPAWPSTVLSALATVGQGRWPGPLARALARALANGRVVLARAVGHWPGRVGQGVGHWPGRVGQGCWPGGWPLAGSRWPGPLATGRGPAVYRAKRVGHRRQNQPSAARRPPEAGQAPSPTLDASVRHRHAQRMPPYGCDVLRSLVRAPERLAARRRRAVTYSLCTAESSADPLRRRRVGLATESFAPPADL